MRRWIIIPVMGLCVATVMGAAIVDRYQDQERAGVAAEERDALDEACVLESETRRQRGPASCPPARHRSDSHVAHWPGDLLEAPVKMLFPLIAFIFPCTFIVLFFPIVMKFMNSGL